MKLEHVEELITILGNDSDGNPPTVALLRTSPMVSSLLPESSQRSPTPLSHQPLHNCQQKYLSIIDSLKKIQASKGVKNVFKTLDFDTLDI